MREIFLSASVPDIDDLTYGRSADPLLIHAAIRALCLIALGHKRIVWGGHPAITPMIWASCQNLGVDYATSVHLYQSEFFPPEMRPKENDSFGNITYVEAGRDLEESLVLMRAAMISGHEFETGIFIGGRDGVVAECEMFMATHPRASAVIFPSTGGAALALSAKYPKQSAPGGAFVDFVSYLSKHIQVEGPFKPR